VTTLSLYGGRSSRNVWLKYEKWGTSGVWKSIPGWLGADKDNDFDLAVSDGFGC